MDPQTNLQDLLAAVEKHDWDRAGELSEELLCWVQKGGIPPTTMGSPKLGRFWHRTVTEFVCYLARSHVRDARKRRRKRTV